MKLFKHLTGKLLALTITILTLAVIFVTVANIISFSISYKQALEERSITVAENIRSVVYKNLKYFPLNGFTGIPAMLQDVLVNNPRISYCYITDAGRNILYHSNPAFNYSDQKIMAQAYTFSDQNARGETIPLDHYYESIIPIIYENNYLGTIHVGIEKNIIEQKIFTMLAQNAAILLLFLTLAIYLLYQQVTRHIIKPIDLLVGQAVNIAKHHDTAGTIPITSEDEVGKLGEAFNEMKTSVDSYIRELNIRNKALQAINMIADKLYQSFDIPTIAREAVESIVHYSNSPSTVLFELDEKNQLLRLLYSRGFNAHVVKVGSILPLEGSLSGLTVKRKQIVTTLDIANDETIVPEVRAALLDDGLTSCISIPLLFQDKVYGVMNLLFTAQDRGDFQEYEKETLFALGKTIGLAMANARHVDQIKEEVTERQRAEESLRASENKYRNIFNNTTEGIFQTTPEGRFLTANRALARILAYDSPEDLTTSINNLSTDLYVHPERRKEFLDIMSKQGFVRDFEYQAYRHDRRIIDVSVSVDIVRDENNKPLYFEGVLRDITELKKYRGHLEELVRERTAELTKINEALQQEVAERQRAEASLLKTFQELQDAKDMLIRTEKMAAIGKLSFGVAHEILNPLNIISLRLQMLEMLEEPTDNVREFIDISKKQIERIVKITQGMNDFSQMRVEMIPENLNEIVESSLAICQPQMKIENIQVTTSLFRDIPDIKMDRTQIMRVFVNIINNSVDAMRGTEKKNLMVTTQLRKENTGAAWARLTIEDNGHGISEENLTKIFDLFFTTKDPDKGTGMGLSIVYSIINEHGGHITATNNDSGGASFIIDLPVAVAG